MVSVQFLETPFLYKYTVQKNFLTFGILKNTADIIGIICYHRNREKLKLRAAELQRISLRRFCLFKKDFTNNTFLTPALHVVQWFKFMHTIMLQVTCPSSGTFVLTASYTIYQGKSLLFYFNHSIFLTANKENSSFFLCFQDLNSPLYLTTHESIQTLQLLFRLVATNPTFNGFICFEPISFTYKTFPYLMKLIS